MRQINTCTSPAQRTALRNQALTRPAAVALIQGCGPSRPRSTRAACFSSCRIFTRPRPPSTPTSSLPAAPPGREMNPHLHQRGTAHLAPTSSSWTRRALPEPGLENHGTHAQRLEFAYQSDGGGHSCRFSGFTRPVTKRFSRRRRREGRAGRPWGHETYATLKAPGTNGVATPQEMNNNMPVGTTRALHGMRSGSRSFLRPGQDSPQTQALMADNRYPFWVNNGGANRQTLYDDARKPYVMGREPPPHEIHPQTRIAPRHHQRRSGSNCSILRIGPQWAVVTIRMRQDMCLCYLSIRKVIEQFDDRPCRSGHQ